ncbi:MAG TPA: PEP-CTERM sorting domain-containing protein [Gemmataceae bacterium]|nr:PEP-CTERM sorting domain-containing protein [Gemmataceae bacterium]
MKPSALTVCAVLALLVSAALGRADVIAGGGSGGGYQPFAMPNQGGAAYWDQHSLDGNGFNVGYFLSSTGAFTPQASAHAMPALNLQWFGNSGSGPGTASPSITFAATGPVTTQLLLTVAANAGINQLGWYNVNSPNDLHPLYTGATADPNDPKTQTFDPNGEFGLYLKGAQGTYFSQTSLNPAGDTINGGPHQHFAVFQDADSGRVFVGVEDLFGNIPVEFTGDFNDIVISLYAPRPPTPLQAPETPEPPSVLLFAAAGLGLAGWVWRRRSRIAKG